MKPELSFCRNGDSATGLFFSHPTGTQTVTVSNHIIVNQSFYAKRKQKQKKWKQKKIIKKSFLSVVGFVRILPQSKRPKTKNISLKNIYFENDALFSQRTHIDRERFALGPRRLSIVILNAVSSATVHRPKTSLTPPTFWK